VRPDDGSGLPPGSRDLDTKLVAALERVGQALRVELRERAMDEGLSPTQAQILLRLASERPPGQRVGALAAALDVRQPTISDAVAALERKGLLERRPDAGDARAAKLALTAHGRAVADRLSGWDERARAELRRLPRQARKALLTLLLDLIAGLQAAGVVGVARTCRRC
jgi:DNA-binding MarR family transcriptional regulator